MNESEVKWRKTVSEMNNLISKIFELEQSIISLNFAIGLLKNRMRAPSSQLQLVLAIQCSINVLEEHKKEMLSEKEGFQKKYDDHQLFIE